MNDTEENAEHKQNGEQQPQIRPLAVVGLNQALAALSQYEHSVFQAQFQLLIHEWLQKKGIVL